MSLPFEDALTKWAHKRFPEIPAEAFGMELNSIVYEFTDDQTILGFELSWQIQNPKKQFVETPQGRLEMWETNTIDFVDKLPNLIAEIWECQ